MSIGERILVPVDGSSFAEQALPFAGSLARRSEGVLRLVGVHAPIPLGDGEPVGPWEAATREALGTYLLELAPRVAREARVPCEHGIRDGAVVEQIIAAAEEWQASLVVTASHGRGGLSRLWLGSVADGLVRSSPVPLLLVRPLEVGSVDLAGDVVFGDVLVPLDGSQEGESVLPLAVELARSAGGGITLYRAVYPGVVTGSPYFVMGTEEERGIIESRRTRAAEYLEGVAGRLRSDDLPVRTVVSVETDVAGAILELARGEGGRTIALTTHGRGGLKRLLLGSVADKLVRGADRPVLLHRPPGGE